ncbi:MAG TPA: alpha/beta hydrolase [Alphaproteobacteria bacterium]|nr:alpha/beta hydrolase [Alphaproteobacteria bacterium]
MKKKIADFLLTFVLFYAGVLALLFFAQREMMYHPTGPRPSAEELGIPTPQTVRVQADDGLEIEGWYWPPENSDGPVMVYFHGNGQDYPYWTGKIMQYRRAMGLGVLLAEYRGYGGNPGHPTEAGLMADARAYIGWLQREQGVPPSRMIFNGESLGTGIAVRMAAEFAPRAVILESPYSSTAAIAQGRYFFAPVSLLMLDQFRSIDVIGEVKSPNLFMHAVQDTIIRIAFSRELYEAAAEPKQFIEIPQGGHNDLYENGAFAHGKAFIEEVLGKAGN